MHSHSSLQQFAENYKKWLYWIILDYSCLEVPVILLEQDCTVALAYSQGEGRGNANSEERGCAFVLFSTEAPDCIGSNVLKRCCCSSVSAKCPAGQIMSPLGPSVRPSLWRLLQMSGQNRLDDPFLLHQGNEGSLFKLNILHSSG